MLLKQRTIPMPRMQTAYSDAPIISISVATTANQQLFQAQFSRPKHLLPIDPRNLPPKGRSNPIEAAIAGCKEKFQLRSPTQTGTPPGQRLSPCTERRSAPMLFPLDPASAEALSLQAPRRAYIRTRSLSLSLAAPWSSGVAGGKCI